MKIERIVLKKLRKEISGEESLRLQEWIDASDENKKFFSLLESLKGQGEILDHLAEIDIEEKWEALLKRCSEQKKFTALK